MTIVIIGNTGTGKTTIGNLLSKRIGYAVYEIGIFVKKLYLEELYTTTKLENKDRSILTCDNNILFNKQLQYIDNMIKTRKKDFLTDQRLSYVSQMIRTHGKDYFVSQLMRKISNENIIIIGARSFCEIDVLKNKLLSPFFVGLTCEKDLLTKRFISREVEYMRPENAKKIFEKRTDTEILWGVDNILNFCDIILPTENIQPFDAVSIIIEAYKAFCAKNINI
jgi:dephospho-CoA kinase